MTELTAAIVGATGYTGAELVRLLHGHPHIRLGGLFGDSTAGKPIAEVLPSLARVAGTVQRLDPESLDADLVFCALPHGASAPIVDALRSAGKVVFDLSADFRLSDPEVYRQWYGEHGAPARFSEGVYGLPELHREAIRSADLVAVPGCYPTAAVLALAPLLSGGLVELSRPIIIDAKTGTSGAGRKLRQNVHFSEAAEGIRGYAVGGRHRHTPEIEQELAGLAGRGVQVVFSPHLAPMIRGILATAYLEPIGDPATFAARARSFYEGSPSVTVLDDGIHPDTLWVRGSNAAMISYWTDRRTGWVIAQCAIDNLVKGAAGQAVQCANLRFGIEEGTGLGQPAHWP